MSQSLALSLEAGLTGRLLKDLQQQPDCTSHGPGFVPQRLAEWKGGHGLGRGNRRYFEAWRSERPDKCKRKLQSAKANKVNESE
jgi:hypothetical protein